MKDEKNLLKVRISGNLQIFYQILLQDNLERVPSKVFASSLWVATALASGKKFSRMNSAKEFNRIV